MRIHLALLRDACEAEPVDLIALGFMIKDSASHDCKWKDCFSGVKHGGAKRAASSLDNIWAEDLASEKLPQCKIEGRSP